MKRVWIVNIVEDEEWYTYPIQKKEVVRAEIAVQEDIDTTKPDNSLIPRAATIQFVCSILHPKNPFLDMC